MSWHKSSFFSISGFKKSNIIDATSAKVLNVTTKDVVAVFSQVGANKVDCTVFQKNWFSKNFPKLRYFFTNFYASDNPYKYGYAHGSNPINVFKLAKEDLVTKLTPAAKK